MKFPGLGQIDQNEDASEPYQGRLNFGGHRGRITNRIVVFHDDEDDILLNANLMCADCSGEALTIFRQSVPAQTISRFAVKSATTPFWPAVPEALAQVAMPCRASRDEGHKRAVSIKVQLFRIRWVILRSAASGKSSLRRTMDLQPAEGQLIGTHLVQVVDDLVFIRTSGVMERNHLEALISIGDVQIKRYGYYLSVVDGTLGTTMTAAARRHNAQWLRDNPAALSYSVIFGAGKVAQTIFTLLNRAAAILSLPSPNIDFASDQVAALELVGRARARLQTELTARLSPL